MCNKFQNKVYVETRKRLKKANEAFEEKYGDGKFLVKDMPDGTLDFSGMKTPEGIAWIAAAEKEKSFYETLKEVRKEIRKGPRL